ncbi:MAG: PD40 domain-containing protein [Anaerolineales bacterium]|nr:MAG: PD40 domain-containing protein [Anaerolineales bacterium]
MRARLVLGVGENLIISRIGLQPDPWKAAKVGIGTPCGLVFLDDYHFIETQSIDNALTFLLDHLPPQMHLVIASRTDPALPLSRLRAGRQLVELRAADLRFTPDEVAAFLNEVMDLGLGTDHVASLEVRTEGWIAGLHLAALSMQDHEDTPSLVAAFLVSQHYVLDYLVEEVLARQVESAQNFLLQTSILGRMTGPLCDAATGEGAELDQWGVAESVAESVTNGQAMLDRLEHANLFVAPLDDRQRWYRYHRLFSDFLRARLHQMHPDWVPVLHRRASEWCAQDELMDEAIGHTLAARDFERAADLIEMAAEGAMMRSEVATLLGWLEGLPDRVLSGRPSLIVYQAGMLFAPEAAAQGPQGAQVLQTVSGGPIYALEAGGLGQTRPRYLTTGMDPALSPDGQQVAFTRWEDTQHGAPGSLWVINLDGTGERMLLSDINQPKSPAWSPDGSQIAFLADRTGGWQVWLMAADGSNQRPLFPDEVQAQLNLQYHGVDERVISWQK